MDILALGTQPISESSPAGADAKYEPEYEAMMAEISKLSSVSQAEPISWQNVIDQASAILANKSKDITAAAYMAVALQQENGAAGLLEGLKLLGALFTNFWDTAYPPKAKARRRVNAVQWWHERALDLLKKESGGAPVPAAMSAEIISSLRDFDSLTGSLMEDSAPLRDMIEAARALPVIPEETPKEPEPPQPQEAPQPPEPAPPPPQAAPEPPRPAPASRPAPVQITSDMDAAALQSAFVEAATAYAFKLRSDDPSNYLAWQLPRAAIWGKIAALPPAESSGETRIPPPDSDRFAAVERLLSGQNWLKAALAADDLFSACPLCFDLQRMADEALANLGPMFKAAQSSLRSETLAFARRLSGITSLTYDGGTPFASPAALSWLESIEQENTPASGSSEKQDKISAAISEARELLSGGDTAEALRRLEDAQGSSAAGNLRLRCEELKILCSRREIRAASALARSLVAQAERDGMAKLEPDLAVETLSLACTALDLAEDAEGAEKIRETLAGLRPSAVLGWK